VRGSTTRPIIIRACIALLLLTWLPSVVSAQDAPSTPVTPDSASTPVAPDDTVSRAFEFYPVDTGFGSYFDETVEAGSSVTLTALIGNTGNVPQDLRTYAVDAYTADGGGFAAADYGTPPNDVTSWVDYSEEIFTIEVGTGIERTFTVTVPEGTEPGQYITAVAAQHAESLDIEGSVNFRQIIRYAIPVFITVPGEMSAGFEIGEISITTRADTFIIEIAIQNTGDVRVRPEGEVELLDSSGALLASVPVAMDSVYARDQTVMRAGAPTSSGAGPFRVRVNLTDPETGVTASGEAADLTAEAPVATPVPTTINITSASVTPAPSADDVQFANVEATITNDGDPIANAQLSLIASVDGEEVERFPISQSLSLQSGDTPVSTRYIPLTGWTSGEWTFELLLETVESSGAAVVVGRQAIEGTITIP